MQQRKSRRRRCSLKNSTTRRSLSWRGRNKRRNNAKTKRQMRKLRNSRKTSRTLRQQLTLTTRNAKRRSSNSRNSSIISRWRRMRAKKASCRHSSTRVKKHGKHWTQRFKTQRTNGVSTKNPRSREMRPRQRTLKPRRRLWPIMFQTPRANSRQHKKQWLPRERPIKKLCRTLDLVAQPLDLQQLDHPIQRLWRLWWNSEKRWKKSSKHSRIKENNSTTSTMKDPSTRLKKNKRPLKKKKEELRKKPRGAESTAKEQRPNTRRWWRSMAMRLKDL